MNKATFGAGCFWGVESLFRAIPGVIDVAVGYEGGTKDHPTYEDVCTDETGHAEVVEIDFDPARVPYRTLVETFFAHHDPTTLNRQGPDAGTQYRSVIFVHDDEQLRVAREVRTELASSGRFLKPIVTAIEPVSTFWRAEEYHQNYFAKKGIDSTCHL